MLEVNEIFQTIQGEGPNMGKPAIFLRLAGCNLRCDFCDTKYSWKHGKKMDNEQIIELFKKVSPCRLLVVTGGEPMLQQGKMGEQLVGFLHEVREREDLCIEDIEVETNGTLLPNQDMYWNTDSLVISPKIFTEDSAKLFDRIWNECPDIISVKLVIGTKKEFQEQINWIGKMVKAPIISQDIFVMPKGTDNRTLKKKAKWIIPICIQQGFRFSPRLQYWVGIK